MRTVDIACDMQSGCVLRLIEQDDGDVVVLVVPPGWRGSTNSVEVCTAQGGTRFPGVAKLLRQIMDTVEKR